MKTERVSLEPAWILHRRPYRDSSVLLDLLTPGFGRIALIGRGQRQGRQAGQLQSLRPLRVDFVRRGELGTLGRFEAAGLPLQLTGQALWSSFYLNELVLRLVPRDDGQSDDLYQYYSAALRDLAGRSAAVVLRRFEYQLLDHLGYALEMDESVDPAAEVHWDPVHGLRPARSGVSVAAVQALLNGADDERILPTRDLLAAMLDSLLGHRPLESARMLRELVALRRNTAASAQSR